MTARSFLVGVLLVAAGQVAVPALGGAQGAATGVASRKCTTVAALVAYPVFFHGQNVRLRAALRAGPRFLSLEGAAREVLVAGDPVRGLEGDPTRVLEIAGLFVDVGRLEPGDPRLSGIDVSAESQARAGRSWPGVGEIFLLVATAAEPPEAFAAPSIRAAALDPSRYEEQSITVTGRFRGRNLYGDQPDAPGRSRWDFVLQSADASLWVVGLRPRGQGFTLDVDARVDTGRWLEVAGVLRRERGLVVLEGTSVRLGQATSETAPAEPAARVPVVGPPPDVVFSTPTQDETDVPVRGAIRVQFSRDMDPASIKGQVRVLYTGQPPARAATGDMPPIEFTTSYNEGTRVLEIRFARPLEPYRTVRVELLAGMRATDGAALTPWTLTFSLGG